MAHNGIDFYLWISNRAVGYDYIRKQDCVCDANARTVTYYPDYETAVRAAKRQDIR